MLAGVAIGLVVLLVLSVLEGTEPHDSGTIVPGERFADMGRYQQTGFDVLAGFAYGALPDADPALPVRETVPRDVRQLDGQRVGVVGFMRPLDFNGEGATEFLLIASDDLCCSGAPTLPNQFVVVKMKDARRTRFVQTPIVVFGTLRIRPERRDGRVVSLYRLEADGIALKAGAR
jgi:hypothetical protein